MRVEATELETLMRAQRIAQEKLRYVYVGNILDKKSNSTHCPHCGHLLVGRDGYQTSQLGVKSGKCEKCGQSVKMVGP